MEEEKTAMQIAIEREEKELHRLIIIGYHGKILERQKDRVGYLKKLRDTLEREQLIKMHLKGQEYSDSPVQFGNRSAAEKDYNKKYGK